MGNTLFYSTYIASRVPLGIETTPRGQSGVNRSARYVFRNAAILIAAGKAKHIFAPP